MSCLTVLQFTVAISFSFRKNMKKSCFTEVDLPDRLNMTELLSFRRVYGVSRPLKHMVANGSFAIAAAKVGCPVCFTKLHVDLEVSTWVIWGYPFAANLNGVNL